MNALGFSVFHSAHVEWCGFVACNDEGAQEFLIGTRGERFGNLDDFVVDGEGVEEGGDSGFIEAVAFKGKA